MTFGRGLVPLAVATLVAVAVAFGMIFFYAPLDADQGFIQKIFYLHVPMAIVAILTFVVAGVMGLMHLRTGDRRWDLRSYVAIHLGTILGVGVLATGSIWARASWGHWWVWSEPMLVAFLIVFLLYAVYPMLRFSIEDPGRQARSASVFAVAAGAFVPLNFAVVRSAESLTHPQVLSTTSSGMPGEMLATFLACLVAMTLVAVTLWKLELTAKSASESLRRLRRRVEAEADHTEGGTRFEDRGAPGRPVAGTASR